MRSSVPFVRRLRVKDYKSLAKVDIELGPLTFLVGANGAGKSNLLDALRLVSDALSTSMDHALRERGGISEVRRRSGGHPRHFRVALEFVDATGSQGSYAFEIGARKPVGFIVSREICVYGEHQYRVQQGRIEVPPGPVAPPAHDDRLYLTNAAGLPEFRPVYDALSKLAFYNLDPAAMRELQSPDSGDLLRRDGSNLASVVDRMGRSAPETLRRVEEFLGAVVPGVEGVEVRRYGPKEAVEFRQRVGASPDPWRFPSLNMSDGTMRALGILVALFQQSDGEVPLVGIEEPEMALHPGASGVLIDALRAASQRTQVLVTTHSPDLLDDDRLAPDEILAVEARDGATEVARVDAASRSALSERLFTAGELLRTDQLRPDPDALRRVREGQLSLFGDPP